MKKKLLPILLSAIIALGAFSMMACSASYTIAFITNGGSKVESIVAKEGEAITKPDDPTKEGHDFKGWFTDSAFKNAYTFPETMPAESFNLYAKWEKSIITVTFDTQGGSSVGAVSGEALSSITIPDDPTKEGYHFAGWFNEKSGTSPFDFVMPVYSKTVYAKWVRLEEKTGLDFNSNWTVGDASAYTVTVDGKNTTFTTTEDKGEYSLIGTIIPQNVKAYNTFVLNITGTEKEEILIKCQNGGVKVVENKYMMTGKANQKIIWTVTSENLTDGQAPMNFYIFVRPGQKGGNATLTIHDFDLYRSRAEGESFQSALFFNTDGGTAVDTIFADAGAAVTRPTTDPTKAGYIFINWYANTNLTTLFVFDKMPEGKTTVHAKWESKKQVTLTFNSNGGSAVEAMTKPAGSTLVAADKPANPTKADVLFDAWYLDSAFTKAFEWKTMPEDNATLYARWVVIDNKTPIILSNEMTTKEKYDIVINDDGSTTVSVIAGKNTYSMFGTKLEVNAKDYSQFEIVLSGTKDKQIMFKCQNGGITVIETKLTMTGEEQTFLWKVDPAKNMPDGNLPMDFYMCLDPGVKHETAPATGISATIKSIKLYRAVEPGNDNEQVIHFVANGGYAVKPMFAVANASITLPTTTKRGFKFGGWFTNAELTSAFNASAMPANNTVVYAKWTEDTDAITEYALKKDGWSTVKGYTNYAVSVDGNAAKINFEHTAKWNATAAAAYEVKDMGADGARYSKIKIKAKLLSTSLENKDTTLRIRFYSLDQNFIYNGATTATVTVKILADELNKDVEFVIDLNTVTGSPKLFLNDLLISGKFAIAMNIYTGTDSADHGVGSLLINSFIFA